MGLREIERKLREKSAYQRKEAEIMLEELDSLIENVEALKKGLKKFEKKHSKEIKGNQDYYQKVSRLRDELGLPEEIGVYEWKESPSFMEKLRGSGFYDQLANEILELGRETINSKGGLISLAELVIQVNRKRPGKIVSPKDVTRSLDKLISDKLIQPLRKLPSGVLIVEFVSIEMSPDQQSVFDLAARFGFLTREKLIIHASWEPERASRVLNELVQQGMVLKDETYHEGTKYWFPSLGES
ncbi:MAG: hypothetical protein GPJ54_15840 [Candidatus Heimdallarchaeota archaeon]|nr:hypothetical protein [Candidatus Heimdallarchaeota archaeon]